MVWCLFFSLSCYFVEGLPLYGALLITFSTIVMFGLFIAADHSVRSQRSIFADTLSFDEVC